MNFQVIALAVSFSPTTEAMMEETLRLVRWFDATLLLIHAGAKTSGKINAMQKLVDASGWPASRIQILWVPGEPADQILRICREQQVDLLVAGALKKENLVNHYLGSVARTIMRKATCSICIITAPSKNPKSLKNIVVDAEGNSSVPKMLRIACTLASKETGCHVHVVRELKLLGLALSAREQCTENEYDMLQHKMEDDEKLIVEDALKEIPHQGVDIHVNVVSGKSGYELAQLAKEKKCDLLIIKAPKRRFSIIDRIFTHDQEYIFSDLPCNVLLVQTADNHVKA